MTYNPFEDEAQTAPTPAAKPAPTPAAALAAAPAVEQGDNWVSFSFNSAPGYDRIGATVHGDPAFVANAFGIKDFDGRISTLMKQAVAVDGYFKKQYGGQAPGKA